MITSTKYITSYTFVMKEAGILAVKADGYAKANRLKPSGISGKECVLRIHLVPALGDKALASITTEDVQNLKGALSTKSPKTVNNVLTVLNVLMRAAVE